MEQTLFVLHHPAWFLLFMGFFATVLAALAWGRTGAIIGIAVAPIWAILFMVGYLLMEKPENVPLTVDHLHFVPILKAIGLGTAAWLVAAVPGVIMGLAIRSLKRGHA